jgi:hypothetical protein
MQLCNPPIAVAALYVQKRRSAWADPTESCATIFDRAGITMGLVHDTVAAMMRSQFGEKASEVYWSCHVTFGFEVCDEDKPEQDGGEIDREIFPEQDDADSDEMEEDDDEESRIRPGRRRGRRRRRSHPTRTTPKMTVSIEQTPKKTGSTSTTEKPLTSDPGQKLRRP